MKISDVLSRTQSSQPVANRKHIPLTVSPVNKEASQSLEGVEGTNEESKVNTNDRVSELDEGHLQRRVSSGEPVFKPHHESSIIELFYDLFFVANLTTFTKNHEITSGEAMSSYIGFFTLMWFTWLQTSLFDVRFATDSVVSRFFKMVSFGIMTGFAVLSSQYSPEKINSESPANTSSSFQAMATILMISRLALMLQYGMVLWYVKDYKKAKMPLAFTIAILFIASMVYLGTHFGFPVNGQFPHGVNRHIYIGWYVVAVLEATSIIAVSCVWRVISFKHTHLVERIGLLTLIVMGEGVMGLASSASTILQNSVQVPRAAVGTIVASVILLYFIWVLYFTQIDHDRFGTIRQQIWALLHFPLHVAILLTGEGSTQLIIWNQIVQSQDWLFDNIWAPNQPQFNTTAKYVNSLRTNLTLFEGRFKVTTLMDSYDYQSALANISSYDITTDEGYNKTFATFEEMYYALEGFVFENFNVEVPETDAAAATDDSSKVTAMTSVFATVFLYFIIAAGSFLLALGFMYWLGKKDKSRWEYLSILARVAAGIGLTLVAISYSYATGDALFWSPWMIPMVTLVYGFVIGIDNFLLWHWNRTMVRAVN